LNHFTRRDISVFAFAVGQNRAGAVLENSEVQAVFLFLLIFRLIESPAEIAGERSKLRPCAPTPKPFATLLSSRPVVQVAFPVFYKIIYYFTEENAPFYAL